MRLRTPRRHPRVVLAAAAAALVLGGVTAPAPALSADLATTAVTAGCGRAPALATGNHTITSGGQSRQFRLDVPAGYDSNKTYRLVVGLHWWHGTSQDVVNENHYGLKPLAGNSTIFVAPQGIDNAWPNNNGRDITFIDDVLRTVEAALCVDTTQRFATGFSYGGGMSNALACARADVFRAVAVLNGAQLSGCAGGTQPIAYLGSHGVVDDVLNISQGRALRDRALQNNGCQAQQAPEPAAGSGQHTKTTYRCRDGFPVVWIASDSGHQWAARDRNQQQSFVPGEIWQFFTSLTSPTPTPTPTPTVTPTPTAASYTHPTLPTSSRLLIPPPPPSLTNSVCDTRVSPQ
ncbi:alpha/beta hydrolase family esterase [Cellulomonas timonensis]|uniref:alpha/beta hydrolase family esterase n=1 Tax=Cellulomonas timonensis TaxID=1689271 RepID=UPI000ACBCB42|nr:cellulose-binding protein [Cellulomonas timonensis]